MTVIPPSYSAPTQGSPRACSPRRVEVDEREASAALPGWDYADSFACSWDVSGSGGALTVACALLGPSRSARRVLAGRDLLVRPFGLREAHHEGEALLFPVLVEEPGRVVCGFDDRHLDFRVIVTVSGGSARCTTVVRRHGTLGMAYFAAVGPFHRRLVPHLMRRGQAMRRAAGVSSS
jgi:hypothetical protein